MALYVEVSDAHGYVLGMVEIRNTSPLLPEDSEYELRRIDGATGSKDERPFAKIKHKRSLGWEVLVAETMVELAELSAVRDVVQVMGDKVG